MVNTVTTQSLQTSSSVNESEAHQEKNDSDEAQFWMYLSGKKRNIAKSNMAELDLYLQELTINKDEDTFDLLNW